MIYDKECADVNEAICYLSTEMSNALKDDLSIHPNK